MDGKRIGGKQLKKIIDSEESYLSFQVINRARNIDLRFGERLKR